MLVSRNGSGNFRNQPLPELEMLPPNAVKVAQKRKWEKNSSVSFFLMVRAGDFPKPVQHHVSDRELGILMMQLLPKQILRRVLVPVLFQANHDTCDIFNAICTIQAVAGSDRSTPEAQLGLHHDVFRELGHNRALVVTDSIPFMIVFGPGTRRDPPFPADPLHPRIVWDHVVNGRYSRTYSSAYPTGCRVAAS